MQSSQQKFSTKKFRDNVNNYHCTELHNLPFVNLIDNFNY